MMFNCLAFKSGFRWLWDVSGKEANVIKCGEVLPHCPTEAFDLRNPEFTVTRRVNRMGRMPCSRKIYMNHVAKESKDI